MPRGRITYKDGRCTYSVDGQDVSKEEWDKAFPSKEIGPTYVAPIQDWSSENGGRGREISQLREDPTAPRVYAKTPSHAMELAKRKGYDRAERA